MTVPAANHLEPGLLTAEVIGQAFVQQYYHILCRSPLLTHKFYKENSILSRPNSAGMMTSVTTMNVIDETVRSLNFSMPEIETVDAQESHHSGIIVLVTGSITGTDNVRRKFTQTFFLAPQEKGYFVLNDVFRYVKDTEHLETAPLASASVTLEFKTPEETVALNGEGEASDLLDKEKESVDEPMASLSQESVEVEGHSVYIRNLPSNATVELVSEEFTRFGPINRGGVQVKTHRDYGYCYGFVEFQSLDSMQNAIKESPLTIGGCRVVVEEKKSTIRVGSTGNSERFISERSKFQNSGFRGRGYLGGRGYGRNELRNNHKLASGPKSNSGRYTEYRYQRVDRS